MPFTDNPLIASLLGATGLGNLVPAAIQPTFGGSPHSAPNIPTYKDRPYLPRAPQTNSQGPAVGGSLAPPTAPLQVPQNSSSDATGGNAMPPIPSQDELINGLKPQSAPNSVPQNPNIPGMPSTQAILSQMGISAPANIDDHLFIHDPQAFKNHPLIAGLLEHGLQGLAYAHPGMNALDSLIGGVRGIQEANSAVSQYKNAQIQAPYNQANALLQTQGIYQHNQLEAADAQKASAWEALQRSNLDNKEQFNQDRIGLQQQALTARQEAAQAKAALQQANTDPQKSLTNSAIQKAQQEVADQKYGGDTGKLTSADLFGIQNRAMQGQSLAKAAGAEATKATTPGKAAGASGQGNKVSSQDRLAYQDASRDETDARQSIQDLTKTGYIVTADNKIKTSGTPEYASELSRRQAALNAATSTRQGIAAKASGRTPSSAPSKSYSPGNPFANQ